MAILYEVKQHLGALVPGVGIKPWLNPSLLGLTANEQACVNCVDVSETSFYGSPCNLK